MPKYYEYKIFGYYLDFTTFCVVEAMHAHASDRKLTRRGSAKFFVKSNGDTVVTDKGELTDCDVVNIQGFIKEHYKEMYLKWAAKSENGFFGEE